MAKHTICFNLRYHQSFMIGIGSLAICNSFIWAYYWLAQSKILFPDGIMILPFVILPVLWFLYVYHWKITVTDKEFIIYRLFRRRKRYSLAQIKKVVAFSSYAEHGAGKYPLRLKLVKKGTLITSYVDFGKGYQEAYSMKLNVGSKYTVGLPMFSQYDLSTEAVISDLSITEGVTE